MIAIRLLRSAICTLLLLFVLSPLALNAEASSRKAGAVTTASSNLNVRSSPTGPVVAKIKKGSYITLLAKANGWWQVEYEKGKTGYCHGDYITIVEGSPVTVNIQSGTLNVRTGPGTGYSKAASLTKGEAVLLLTTENGWSRILYHGTKTGYVSAQYLSGDHPAVSLSVPNFKQTDSRWSDKTLGSNGKTFAQIGCATTAIAMLESFRQGITIYPDVMAQSLRYTPSDDVYWPSHYRAVTGISSYLGGIYAILRQGKPVLFGGKNQYGAQHWVVITGYRGGTDLKAADFTIHDPGTHSRVNLQQFLNQYPTFYKYFCY